jgi:lectin-like protein
MEPIQQPMLTILSGRGLIFTCLLATCLASFRPGSAVGQTLWPENGHYYLIVNQTTTWQQARLLPEALVFMGVRGHLATITSEDENTFVTTQLGDTAGAWLGGEQLPGSSEPAGGWQWITGEPWMHTNWDEGEPNNTYLGGWGKDATGQSEERLQYHHDGTHWNDLPDDPEVVTPRFIVEWDVPQAEDSDGDGIPDNEDDCPNSDLSTTVIIDGCNTGVPNTLFPSGCTISDLIAACAEGASSHGQFVSCVAHVTNDLKKAGTITGQQKGAIQSCAAQADIP